jgi:hypothetical protein
VQTTLQLYHKSALYRGQGASIAVLLLPFPCCCAFRACRAVRVLRIAWLTTALLCTVTREYCTCVSAVAPCLLVHRAQQQMQSGCCNLQKHRSTEAQCGLWPLASTTAALAVYWLLLLFSGVALVMSLHSFAGCCTEKPPAVMAFTV